MPERDLFAAFVEKHGPPHAALPVSADEAESYRDRLPDGSENVHERDAMAPLSDRQAVGTAAMTPHDLSADGGLVLRAPLGAGRYAGPNRP